MANKAKLQIVEGALEVGKPSRPRWRMAKREGEWVRVRVLDADGPTFSADLLAAFRWNVRRIRAEQRKQDAAILIGEQAMAGRCLCNTPSQEG